MDMRRKDLAKKSSMPRKYRTAERTNKTSPISV